MPSSVFVSYAHDDRLFARELAQNLTLQGISVADPSVDLEPGDDWPNDALDMLIGSEALVLVMSGKAAESATVMQELGAATALHKRIVPVRIDHHPMPILLRDRQFLEVAGLSPNQIADTVRQRLAP